MKKLGKLYIATVLLFAVLITTANLIFVRVTKSRNDNANIFMNRVSVAVQDELDKVESDGGVFEGKVDETSSSDNETSDQSAIVTENSYIASERVQEIIDNYYNVEKAALQKEYGKASIPERIYYIPIEVGNSSVALLNREDYSGKVWALNSNGSIIGFIIFEYRDAGYDRLRLLMNLCLSAAFIIAVGICIYISHTVLSPFEKLSSYPEKLSKNEISDKLPETKNRLFGRFIWGINMLSDNIQSSRKRVDELSREHVTMLTTIAHGIKTPIANIKLYADAISTGLYQPDGKVNEEDAEIAKKIDKNADEVTAIVKELIDKASGAVVDFEPHIEVFYLKELRDFLEEEYSNRLNVLRIPYTLDMNHNAMVKSDKSGICRILSQLMNNAIKYGNGEGIDVNLSKEEDGYYFVIKNKGEVPDEKELPYIFNSFWRGSNAENTEGSGIGLFEARSIAQGLYGDIYVKADPDKKEMEFDVYIPNDF